MTVAELIELLKQYPSDLRVVTRGYEGGYDDLDNAEVIPLKENVHTAWYYGKHDSPDPGEAADFDALVL